MHEFTVGVRSGGTSVWTSVVPLTLQLFQLFVPSILNFLSAFIIRVYWILSNTFSVSIEMIMCFFPL